ncbi:hypothetical protein HNP67_000348 [Borreliella californiensis]|uniref:Uncharacterized protein n=1 Tax=Borreliella californiensis TaxID=373543 RepID=A0A7W9ZL16_9SPIR|nr:hypothetical protein [Borreliella californiensis]
MEDMLKVNDINDLCKIISDFSGIYAIGINEKIIKFFKEKK